MGILSKAGKTAVKRLTKAQRIDRANSRIAAGVALGASTAAAAVPTIAVLSKQLREAKTEAERTKIQAQIEKLMRKMKAEEAGEKRAQAALDRSARLGDKGPDMKSKGGMASKTKMSYGGMSTKGKK